MTTELLYTAERVSLSLIVLSILRMCLCVRAKRERISCAFILTKHIQHKLLLTTQKREAPQEASTVIKLVAKHFRTAQAPYNIYIYIYLAI